MTKIKKYVFRIEDELAGAKDYAERYIEYKAQGDNQNAQMFKEMSNQELEHSSNWHKIAIKEIEEIKKVFTPTIEMEEKWNKSHQEYVEKSAWIRQMLAM